MTRFTDFSFNDAIFENLAALGFKDPTPIQQLAIPHLLNGSDLIGLAQTGTGKTAAFSLPSIEFLLKNPKTLKRSSPRVLVLVPTRELCSQVELAIRSYIKGLSVHSVAIYGGVDQAEQVQKLRDGVEILVATPGRLLDLVSQKQVRYNDIEILILDEADRMLDMGFSEDLDAIITELPKKKHTMLFSATMPASVERLATKMLQDPVVVKVSATNTITDDIKQKVIYCKKSHKFQLLKKILKEESRELVLVFTRTKMVADQVVEYLAQNRLAARALHGDKSQAERERAMTHFKDGAIKVLVATDIASRGLDIEGVSHVINFDMPKDPESYVHRVGRTARAGKTGVAISFCDETEKDDLELIQTYIKSYLKSEKFEGKAETLKFKTAGIKKIPTPGKSQEKTAWLDHSKRQPLLKEGEKRSHPGFKLKKKKRK